MLQHLQNCIGNPLAILQAKRLHGVVPLESAKIETELPSNMTGPAGQKGGSGHKGEFFITITLHSSHAFSCKHPFFLLAAPNQEVQQAWINALWQVRSHSASGV